MTATWLLEPIGYLDRQDVLWSLGSLADANLLLREHHYLGPINSGGAALVVIGSYCGEIVAAQVWRKPTSRRLPHDTWLELSRWCLTPAAGENAGSRNHRYALKMIREHCAPDLTTLISYSDPSHGHTGALYRACNWKWRPTWHRLRTPPTGNGMWQPGVVQSVKDRWIFPIAPDRQREDITRIDDDAAIRFWRANSTEPERRWARTHPQLKDAS